MKTPDLFTGLINKRRPFISAFAGVNLGPTAHCNVEADLTAATAYRKTFLANNPGVKLTFNDMIIKAAANALLLHPLFLCAYNGHYNLYPSENIDIRFPVDIGEHLGWGLVRNADRKTLRQIAIDSRMSIERTRRDTPRKAARWDMVFTYHPIVPEIFNGIIHAMRTGGLLFPSFDRFRRALSRRWRGSFLITNVGPSGIMRMEGPIVQPDILHLMITATKPTPVLIDGAVVIRPMLPLVAKYDCRMTDAAHASRFLTDVKKNLESPERLMGPY